MLAACDTTLLTVPAPNSGSLTFPQGQGQDGSPGLEAFHRAKSLGECFSLRQSVEMLKSPVNVNG